MRKRKRAEEHENLERWLITYADLITLLLAFFIMLYSFSKQDTQKYEEVIGYLKAVFQGGTGILGRGTPGGAGVIDTPVKTMELPIERFDTSRAMDLEIKKKIEDEINTIQTKADPNKQIFVVSDEGSITVRVTDRAFFDPGKADLKAEARQTLDKLVPIIKNTPNHVRVEGHTDNVPIHTGEFKSNWELSVRRATEVVRYIIEHHAFPPQRISASGYAEYRPIVPNDSPENKSRNRRTEIIIVKAPEKK